MIDLFAGIAGFSYAGHQLGWQTTAFVEWDEFNQKIIKKNFPGIPVFGDIRKFKAKKYNGKIDIICGGFPCQPFSAAGKRKGKDDERHLWPEMLRVIRESKPTWVIGENVAGISSMGYGPTLLETLLAKVASVTHLVGPYYNHVVNKREIGILNEICEDLEKEGYKVQSFRIPACAVGAPHRRDRMWIVAHSDSRAKGPSRQSSKPNSIRSNNTIQQEERRAATELNNGWDHVLQSLANAEGRWSGESRNGNKEERRISSIQPQSNISNELTINAMRPANGSHNRRGSDKERVDMERNGVAKEGRKQSSDDTFTSDRNDEVSEPVTNPSCQRSSGSRKLGGSLHPEQSGKEEINRTVNENQFKVHWFEAATLLCRVDDGLPSWMDSDRSRRLKSLGNAIVPQVALEIFKAIEEFENN